MKKLSFFIILIFILTGCSSNKTLTKTNLALDTVITITIYEGGNQEVLNEAFEIVNKYDSLLDYFDQSSEISLINAGKTEVSEELFELISKNQYFSNITSGAFNPLMGSLITLWDINEPEIKDPPTADEITEALSHSNVADLVVSANNEIMILDDQASLNLGASAKGFIADKLKEFLAENGVTRAIINLGGNVLLINETGEDFTVGIDYPDNSVSLPLGTMELTNESIVTSGSYQRYFTDESGNIYHHILDPSTGYPVNNELNEVVVITENSLEADILSTSLFVMGLDEGMEFVKNYKNSNINVIFVCDNSLYLTKELEGNFKLGDDFVDSFSLNYF